MTRHLEIDQLNLDPEDGNALSIVVLEVRNLNRDSSDLEVKSIVVKTLRSLIAQQRIELGIPTPTGEILEIGNHELPRLVWERWNLTLEQSIQRIEQEWAMLGRDPRAGEIVWIKVIDRGETKESGALTKNKNHF